MKQTPIAHRRVLDYAYRDLDTLFRDFHITGQGYSDEQAEESRTRYGTNRLSGRVSDTVLYRLRRAFLNPFTIILFVLACISFLTDVVLAPTSAATSPQWSLSCGCCSSAGRCGSPRNCGPSA